MIMRAPVIGCAVRCIGGSDEREGGHVTLTPNLAAARLRRRRARRRGAAGLRRRPCSCCAAISLAAALSVSSGPGCSASSPSTYRAGRRRHWRARAIGGPGDRRQLRPSIAVVARRPAGGTPAASTRIARLTDVAAGEGRRLAPCARPAIEDVRADLGHLGEHRRPARSDIIGMIMGRLADRRLDIAGERGARRSARAWRHAPRAGAR